MKSKKDTLRRVAKLAGVSEMTVSRVLRNSGYVSQETRERVNRIIQETGYVPNRVAGALASASSKLVGVVVPSLSNIVFSEVLSGINSVLNAANLHAFFGVSDYDLDKEQQLVESMLTWRPTGLIVTGLEHRDRTIQLLKSSGAPVVEIMDADAEPIDLLVGLSHTGAGLVVANHFLDRGFRNIGYIGCNLERDLRASKRLQGFISGLETTGIEIRDREIVAAHSSAQLGHDALGRLLRRTPSLDAVYFSNDDVAVGGYMYCLGNGIRVPTDLGIAGFNGLEIGQVLPKPLTTVRTPRYEIGERAAQAIVLREQGESVSPKQDIKFEFVRGATT